MSEPLTYENLEELTWVKPTNKEEFLDSTAARTLFRAIHGWEKERLYVLIAMADRLLAEYERDHPGEADDGAEPMA